MVNKQKKKLKLIRLLILGTILIGSMLLHYLHITQGTNIPSVHAICPYGGLENLWAWLGGRANIQKIFSGTMVLFFLTLLFAILFRRGFCGNICPFGALQEFIGLISTKKFNIQEKVDKHLRYIKYIVLVISVIMAWITASLWFAPYDPWAAFAHIYTGKELFEEYAIGTIILIVTVVASLFINRFFCKYICPAGALYGLIGKFSPLKVNRNKNTCVNCSKCTKSCPMDIDVEKYEEITSNECISCGLCIESCPESDTLIGFKTLKYQFKPLIITSLGVFVFFGSIFLLDTLNLYRVSLPTQAEIHESREYINISDLRGSMTIEQGAFYTGKELKDFYELMEIPLDIPKETPLKYVQTYVKDYDFHVMKAKKASQ